MTKKMINSIKGLDRLTRISLIAILLVLMTTCFMVYAMAASNVTFSGFSPTSGSSNNYIATADIKVTVTSTTPVAASDVQMKVDNVTVYPSVTSSGAGAYLVKYSPTTALANGSHTVNVSVLDSAATSGTKSTSWSFTIDAFPVISTLQPTANAVIETASPKLSASVRDNYDNLNVAVMKIDGSIVPATLRYSTYWVGDEDGNGYMATNPKMGTVEYQAAGLSDGVHTAEVTVTDARGYSSTKSWNFTVATKPVFSNFLPQTNATVKSAPRLEVKVTESQLAANTIVVKDNGSTLMHSYSDSTNIISVDKDFSYGNHQITVSASDTNGNAGSSSWNFIVDNQAPAINVSSPAVTNNNIAITNGGLNFNATLTDISDIAQNAVLKLDDQAVSADFTYQAKTATVKYSSVLPDGNHTLSLTRSDVAGNLQTQTWNINVNVKPVVSQVTPVNFLSLLKPDIAANIKDANNTITAADIKLIIDGIGVTPIFDSVTGNLLYKPAEPLANEAYHNVTISVYNEASLSTTYSWKFYTSTFAEMADENIVNCSACHTYNPDSSIPFQDVHKNKLKFNGDHDIREQCNACHNVISQPASCILCHQVPDPAPPSFPHGSTPTLKYNMTNFNQSVPFRVQQNRELFDCIICHQPGSPVRGYQAGDTDANPTRVLNNHDIPELHKVSMDSCNKCHAKSLTHEHARAGRTDKEGKAITCNTCHKSTDPNVINAIAKKEKDCTSCHKQTAHEELHISTLDSKCQECHNKEIGTEHINNPKTTSGRNYACETCHESGRNDVKRAIASGNLECAACHNKGHNINISTKVPTDISKYTDYQWTTPIEAFIFNGDSNTPAGYEKGQVVFSDRRDVTVKAVWDYYKQDLTAKGWTLKSNEPVEGAASFEARYDKENRSLVIKSNDSSSGSTHATRIEIWYKTQFE